MVLTGPRARSIRALLDDVICPAAGNVFQSLPDFLEAVLFDIGRLPVDELHKCPVIVSWGDFESNSFVFP